MIRPVALALASALALSAGAFASAQDAAPPPSPQPDAGMAAGTTAPTASQPVANPADSRPDTHADTGYAGEAYGPAFRDIDGRLAALTTRAGADRKASTELRAIKSEELLRRKRNGGELRDWDRELLNKRLDAVQAMVGAG